MSTRKPTLFYGLMIALTSLVVGMVVASRFGLSAVSFAGPLDIPHTNSAPLIGPIDAGTFRNIAQEASPTVVSIRTTVMRSASGLEELFGFQNPFRDQAPSGRRPAPTPSVSAGSGFIIDKAGFILTNNHVVEDATEITVKLAGMNDNDLWLPAKVVGTDVLTDSALLQLTETPEYPFAVSKFGDSAQIAPGDWVMAIGNPFSLSNTVTVGVVSAVGRLQRTAVDQRYEHMIQTDAAINRGNSGGPLLNIRGEVIGINTQIVSDQTGNNIGIGFAVPINTIRDILPQLQRGKVVRGRIGVSLSPIPITRADAQDFGLAGVMGAVVSEVPPGPAKTAGLRAGDVIVEFNGKPVMGNDDLVSMVTRTAPGTTVPVKIIRSGKPMTVNVTVEELNLETERAQQDAVSPGTRPEAPKDTGFGMTIDTITPAMARRLSVPSGVVVSDVDPTGPAARGGMQPGDVILEINNEKTSSVEQVGKALDAIGPGRTARVVVNRGGRELLIQMRKR